MRHLHHPEGQANKAGTESATYLRGFVSPLSFAQERLWFLDQYLGESGVYHIPVVFRLQGRLLVDALEKAVTEIVNRHWVLNARIQRQDGKLCQTAERIDRLTLPVKDAAAATPDRESAMRAAIERVLEQPLDLAAGTPLRMTLIRLSDDDHLLVCQIHHIAFDGWSLGILQSELTTAYQAFAAGLPSPLAALATDYGDYAAWQRERMTGRLLDEQLAYWQAKLGDGGSVMDLPADRPPPRVPTFVSGQVDTALPSSLAESLSSLAAQAGTTAYTVIVAAFKVLLARQTGTEDIVIGVPVANRDEARFDTIIGVFLNMLACRTDLGGRPTFTETLRRVWDSLLDAYAHHEVPFEAVVEKLKPSRTAGRTPFFDVVVNLLPSVPDRRSAGLTLTPVEIPDRYSSYAMSLYVREDGTGLSLVYQRERFDSERMRDLLEQLVTLLEQVSADPDRDIYSYSLLTTAARRLLPDPGEQLDLPAYEPVVTTIERVAARQPERAAIRGHGREWSYRELAEAIGGVVSFLRSAGHRAGDVVAITGEASYGYVVAFLGIMAARCVALPMDSSVPPRRQQVMLDAANARRLIVVGQAETASCRCPVSKARADGTGLTAGAAEGAVSEPVCPDDAAYIYFTSGTSGTPKGVLGVHNTLAHLITWERETFTVGPDDRCGLTTRLSFDMVLRDMLLPLTSGGTLCIPPDETMPLDARRVLAWLDQERITLLHIVPTLARRWLEHAPRDARIPRLRWVYFAGEPLTEELVGRWRERFEPGGAAVNYYGTTETMVRTFHLVPDEPRPGVQPVGIALPYCQTVIVNRAWAQCGIGELGEVLLRSRICTLGYINASQQQAERFLGNRFGVGDPTDICYRTGDVGRYRPDGLAEVLGRMDDQVKVHGVRIEPAEVQAAISTHPAVAAAVVMASDGELVGYVVPRNGNRPDPADLRRHLRGLLPDSMIPATFVPIAALPTLANGKVDKKSLPAPSANGDGAEQVGRAGEAEPEAGLRTETERLLARIWCEVLGVRRVGPRDNFFELGGHSLKVVDAVARIRADLGVDLPLRVLFEEPSLESLATVVEQHRTGALAVLDGVLDTDADVAAIIAALEALEEEESQQ